MHSPVRSGHPETGRNPADGGRGPKARRWTVDWWMWLVVVVAALVLLGVAAVWVQTSRRSGTVIAVRRGHRFGKREVR
ncbi:hypothetical protein HEP87_58785 [Streptomyces sp. S1D4-11]